MLPKTYDPDDGKGVREDTLRDSRMEIDNAKYQLERMYVTLDSLADDRDGIWTESERHELREMQTTMMRLTESCEDNMDDIAEELQ